MFEFIYTRDLNTFMEAQIGLLIRMIGEEKSKERRSSSPSSYIYANYHVNCFWSFDPITAFVS